MFGCFRTIGCLVVAAMLAVAGWFTRDMWWWRVTGDPRPGSGIEWESVTPAERAAARKRVESLARPSGPVFANLTPAEASALVLGEMRARYPALGDDAQAAIVGDLLSVRATVDVSRLKGLEGVESVVGIVGAPTQRVALTGTIEILGPGTAQFRVRRAMIGEVQVPSRMIPSVVSRMDQGRRPANAAPDAIVFAIPRHIGDVRVGKGQVTLYKSVK